MDVFTPENLAQYDAVLLNNTTQLKFNDPAQRKALLDFVKGGKGLIGIHAATDNFPTWPEAGDDRRRVQRPSLERGRLRRKETDGWAIKVDDPEHVLNKSFGGKGFVLKDEIYQIKGPYSRDTHRELLSLDMSKQRNSRGIKGKTKGPPGAAGEDDDNPISWIKRYGDGRVFYCSLGHRKEIYWNTADSGALPGRHPVGAGRSAGRRNADRQACPRRPKRRWRRSKTLPSAFWRGAGGEG